MSNHRFSVEDLERLKTTLLEAPVRHPGSIVFGPGSIQELLNIEAVWRDRLDRVTRKAERLRLRIKVLENKLKRK